VSQYLDEYLTCATRNRRESTKANYRDALKPVRARLGDRPLQSITRADVGQLVDWMLTSGRKRSGKPGTRLGARSVRLTLGRLKAAFEMAVDEGKLVRNVVKPPGYEPSKRDVWSQAEVRAFLRRATSDRLHAAWRLSLYGLRRGEVLGLRWLDVDLKARTLTVGQARVPVDCKVRVEPPKSRNSKRTLPLDDALVTVHVLRKVAGHGSLVTTQRYLRPDAQSILDAGDALSAHLTAQRSEVGSRLRAV